MRQEVCMEQFHDAKERGMAFLIVLISLLTPVFATVTVGKIDCPIQFVGRVEEIVESVGSRDAYSIQSVIFKNQQMQKGEAPQQITVEMLENGPFKLKRGEEYQVQLREGRVCWIEEL
jgi:hypothetical protein